MHQQFDTVRHCWLGSRNGIQSVYKPIPEDSLLKQLENENWGYQLEKRRKMEMVTLCTFNYINLSNYFSAINGLCFHNLL